jgi:WhiB family transcriptional regulator, redox-sensing transcriptional regulator
MTGRLPQKFDLAFTFDASEALCAQVDPELFFPLQGDNESGRIAKQICTKCPLITDCLSEAILTNSTDGIWGASTPKDRQRIRRNTAVPLEIQIHTHVRRVSEHFEDIERRKEARRQREQERRSTAERDRRARRKMETTS